MNKVYVVTSGEYSEYDIKGVFTNKHLAEDYIKFAYSFKDDDDIRVEEYVLNEFCNELKKDHWYYFVRMNSKGECKDLYKRSRYSMFDDEINYEFDENDCLCCHVIAKNELHAVKIVNEKRTKLIALNKWNK